MAKGSGRFRNRKLGFKTRINVEVGVVIEEDPIDVDLDIEDDKGHKGVETGVDKDEEGEVHLQAVIASTAAYMARNAAASGSGSSGGGRSDKGKKPEASIPTRGSVKIPEEEYRHLYEPGYTIPVSYIRFSDTVEDCIKGAYYYTMDEDDEDWLEDYNAQFDASSKSKGAPAAVASTSSSSTTNGVEDDAMSGRGTRSKGKAVDRNGGGPSPTGASISNGTAGLGLEALPAPTSPLSEDDFELVMEMFETATDQRAPMTHVNLSLLPGLNDFDPDFSNPLKPHLAKLRPYAKEVYPHWRQRRVARGGKPIIPQLDVSDDPGFESIEAPLADCLACNSTTSRTRTTLMSVSGDETSRQRARLADPISRTSNASSACATTCTRRTRSSSRCRSGNGSSSSRSSSSARCLTRGARCARSSGD